MNKTRRDIIYGVLNELSGSDIESSALVSPDGLVIASTNSGIIKERISADVLAALGSISNNASRKFMDEDLQYGFIKGKSGYIVFCTNNSGEVLVAFVKCSENIEIVGTYMNGIIERISNMNNSPF